MDRLRRILAGGMLAMTLGTVMAASGCRTPQNEVPPGPKYATPGEPSSSVGFNSQPHTYNGIGANTYGNATMPGQPGQPGMPGAGGLGGLGGIGAGSPSDGLPPSLGANGSSYGTPAPSGVGQQPTNNLYGPPGTSGTSGFPGTGR